jgi:AcrR family transcriptional regulator
MTGPSVRPPRQARSQATWERILDAGVALLEDEGFEGFTIAALCRRADVTPPAVYARAPDKDALLLAIYDHAVARIDAGFGLDDATDVRTAVRAVAAGFLGNARLLRSIIHRAAVDPEIFRRGSAATTELGRRFRRVVGGDERAADACFRVAQAAIARRVVYGPQFESDIELPDEAFVEMLGDMCEAYLRARAVRRDGDS